MNALFRKLCGNFRVALLKLNLEPEDEPMRAALLVMLAAALDPQTRIQIPPRDAEDRDWSRSIKLPDRP